MAKKKNEQIEQNNESASQDILANILKENKDDHYNFVTEAKEIKGSTGSLIFDSQVGGGISAGGLIRCVGVNEGGKTSESLEMMRNYLRTVPKAKGLLVKAEGRLSKEMQIRSGVKFVWSPDEWEDGTCFVLETNIYDIVISLIRQLVMDNPNDNKYYFLLDSMDGLILKSDMAKDVTEAGKVAGAPALTKKFMQRLAISMNKLGHTCNMIGQVSAKVQIDPYAPKDNRQIASTGGNAALHFSNWIFQFEPRFNGDLILENPKDRPDPIKNKILGHWCKITIKKSTNESTNMSIKYPIKYGRTGGQSIWKEYEIIDVLTMFGLIDKRGAWMNLHPSLIEEAAKSNIEIVEQHQGMPKLQKYLEDNKEVTDWLFERLKKTIISENNGNEVSEI